MSKRQIVLVVFSALSVVIMGVFIAWTWADLSTLGRICSWLFLSVASFVFFLTAINAWFEYTLDQYERDLQRHNRDYTRNHAHKPSRLTKPVEVQVQAPAQAADTTTTTTPERVTT